MPGIFNTYNSYCHLLLQLKRPGSIQYKLRAINYFLGNALKDPDQRKNRSYYEDILPVYLELVVASDLRADRFDFMSPDEISEMMSYIQSLGQTFLSVLPNDLSAKLSETEEILTNAAQVVSTVSRFEGGKSERSGAPAPAGGDVSSINLALIERSDDPVSDSIASGIVYKLHLNSVVNSPSLREDEGGWTVQFKSPIEGDDTELLEHLRIAVNVAKTNIPPLKGARGMFSFTFFFDDQTYTYSGTSLGLPACCLAYNAILINSMHKYYYKFKDDAVFTSEIDENGNLVKLDRESLKIKIQTVFYSKYRKLVLPEDNITEAKEILNALVPSTETPSSGGVARSAGAGSQGRGGLELIFLPNFQSVFKRLDLVERCELKFLDKLKIDYHRYHVAANWLLSILSLVIIAFFAIRFAIPYLDRNPYKPGIEANHFVAYNQHGIKVWESPFEVIAYSDVTNICRISDIDGDGKREILALHNVPTDSAERRKIYFFNANGSLKWEYSKPAETLFYKGKFEPDNFTWAQIHLEDLNSGSKNELIAFGQLASSFPAKLSIFSLPQPDSRSQTPFGNEGIKEQAYYWHCGNFFCINFVDLNRDGRKEILCGGVSNLEGHRQGVMVVFDSRYVNGVSMNTDPFGDGRKGTETYYVLFPQTAFTNTIGHGDNVVLDITPVSENKIQVQVKEVGPGEETAPFILYFLDYDLKPIGMNPSNTFDTRIKDFYSGDYRHYQDSLLHSIRFWTGDSLVSTPTLNKYYLEAKK